MKDYLELKNLSEDTGYGIWFRGEEGKVYCQEAPAILYVKNESGILETYRQGYTFVEEKEGEKLCEAHIETNSGSRFIFIDHFAIDRKMKHIKMKRQVKVEKANVRDQGFFTEFSLYDADGFGMRLEGDCEVFVPGIWYRHNKGAVKGAFASDMYERNYLFRATRMALPYVQLCDIHTGAYISLCHKAPVPDTKVLEQSADWIVDETLQYASLGIRAEKNISVRYVYPGNEGEVNYIDRSVSWAKRAHPVRPGVPHSYECCILTGSGKDSYERMKNVWRHWYKMYDPQLYSCDLKEVYETGVEVLDVYCQEYNHVMGIPFWTTVPEGTVSDISYQMGFVGQQTQCAYHLICFGLEHGCGGMVEKGKRIIEFWVERSMQDSFWPKVWYNVFPPEFKEDYPSYLRTVSDGMEGILNCYIRLKKEGMRYDRWLDFCRSFAQRLANVQGSDGSFVRACDREGRTAHPGKYNTSNVIRFLSQLYFETGEESYKKTAVRAGEYCFDHIYQEMAFIGGTADNDNTIDKEAGMQALYAFLALYDLTEEEKWIQAAEGAADFCETWTYSWSFPVYPYKGNGVFSTVDQTGLSLIATGHSHCDVMMGYCPYDYFRLFKLTGDSHYYQFARMILYNTKQTTDWDGRHGHAYKGLVEESGELALQYHNGLGKWLPWCTIAEIEAIWRLKETYGEYGLPEVKIHKI